jgi:Cu-processing system permease protein
MSAVAILAASELRDAARRRWLWLYGIAYVLLAALAAWGSGGSGFGRAAASLIGVDVVVIPLLALVMGALAYARDRERGTLGYLLSLPVTVDHVLAAKALALAAILLTTLAAGFAIAFGSLAVRDVPVDPAALSQFAAESILLAFSMGGLGLAISTIASRTPLALGAALGVWLVLIGLGDLGLLATSLATHLGIGALVAATMLNPVDAYKIAAVAALNGSIDVLGPGGRLATDIFGAWLMPILTLVLSGWLVVALGIARWSARRSDAL